MAHSEDHDLRDRVAHGTRLPRRARTAGQRARGRGLARRARDAGRGRRRDGRRPHHAASARARTGADLVVFDDELLPKQQKNLEGLLDARVIDRSAVILDIFARHARSREGQLQVELAQMEYRMPRLAGVGREMSRLGGGINTRGPGESKLESDRQVIRRRIQDLKERLVTVAEQRERSRRSRAKEGLYLAALVGYTNAGKSTLLNALSGADVLVADQPFATLDPTTRRAAVGDGV